MINNHQLEKRCALSAIKKIIGRQVFDSRGRPTVEAEIITDKACGRAIVPSGASTGKYESVELRDHGKSFHGLGVQKAVNNINKIIAKKLAGKDVLDQESVDNFLISLDGTKSKSKLGANALLAVSMAVCRASANEKNVFLYERVAELYGTKKFILPVPAFNLINGGKHAGNDLDFQEYLLFPVGAKKFSEAMQIGVEVYHELKDIIMQKYGKFAVNVGDEGGFAPPLSCIEEPFDLILEAASNLGYFKKIKLGIDAAANTFCRNGRYYLEGNEFSKKDLLSKYDELIGSYPVFSIEDPFYEDDFDSFSLLCRKKKLQVVGDDLLATNPNRIQKAVLLNSCNCLLLKPNQIGTFTEACDASKLAQENNWNVMASHRSGETEDSFIADLAVGIGALQIKSGAPCRSERLAKYNELIRIEENLGGKGRLARLK